jgi:LytS/YehU family sensor histidine kinase
LQNLQKKIGSSDQNAAEMVLHLSEIYSYILYDSRGEFVALEKELSAIQHLVELIKENGSCINMQVSGNLTEKYIYPLVLFSVLESRLYHSDKENISIRIDAVDETLDLSLRAIILYESLTSEKEISNNMGKENIINARFDLIAGLREESTFIPLNVAN